MERVVRNGLMEINMKENINLVMTFLNLNYTFKSKKKKKIITIVQLHKCNLKLNLKKYKI